MLEDLVKIELSDNHFLEDFNVLVQNTFDEIWNNKEEDIYQEFYSN